MSIVLPILFAAVLVGLYVPRITWKVWLGVGAWIAVVIAYNYLKPPRVPSPAPGASAASGAATAASR